MNINEIIARLQEIENELARKGNIGGCLGELDSETMECLLENLRDGIFN